MSSLEYVKQIDKLYNSVLDSISFDMFSKLKENLNLINEIEKLFEISYSNRKKEGVFYTQKEISNFIYSQALISLLNSVLQPQQIVNLDDLYLLDPIYQDKVKQILLNITVCDPACGSGVFIISVAETLYNLILKLDYKEESNNLKFKILKNLYGYEINESAIKLCKLKLLKWFYSGQNVELNQPISILDSNLKLKNSLIDVQTANFDLVIGNPPYGNILKEIDKEFLKREEIYYKDIYCAFLLKAIDLTDNIIAFLVPKSFLLRQGYLKFRNTLFHKSNLLKIYDIGPNLFKKATNEVQIIIYQKKKEIPKNLSVYEYPETEVIIYKDQNVDSLRICLNENCSLSDRTRKIFVYTFEKYCPYCSSETSSMNRIRIKGNKKILELINKIEQKGDLNYLNIKKFPNMIRGEEARGLKKVKSLLEDNPDNSCVYINAKEDFTYFYFDKNKSFSLDDIKADILKGNQFEYYIKPKLLIKHNNTYPQTLYSEEKVCFSSSIYSLLYPDVNELKYLCAILNSILMQFYCIYAINNQKDTTINLNQYMIRHLPIVHCKQDIKQEIIRKIDKITSEFSQHNGLITDIASKYIKEVDNLIFELYTLSNEEINLIKSKVKDHVDFFKTVY
ncbi:MAG: Eco57I restriction-modification methylase domain-containing protein [Promethearchaeota archaeon]